jgi:hypothetical protein
MSMLKRTRTELADSFSLSSAEILAIVKEIRAFPGSNKVKERHFSQLYPEFVERYTNLFELACEPSFDMARLEYMLGLRDRIVAKEQTVEEASKEVGQTLFDVYVKPKL